MSNPAAGANEPSNAAASVFDQSSSEDTKEVADLLKGRFKILSLLSADKHSSHYLAHAAGNALVRVEVLSKEAAKDREQVELFYLQNQAAAKLSHKNIIGPGPVQRFDTIYLSASRYEPGLKTLRDALDQKGAFDFSRAIDIARQIASALDYAHRLGVLHLRLHPQNILLSDSGKALVTGFGFDARPEYDLTHWKRIRSCPVSHLSPEQIDGDKIDYLSDLYCLGILLFEMLTDRVPFDSPDPEHTKRKRLSHTPWPPHSLCPNIPEPLSNLVVELLKPDPRQRIQSAANFSLLAGKLSGFTNTIEESPASTQARTQYDIIDFSSEETKQATGDPAQVKPHAFHVLLPVSEQADAAATAESEAVYLALYPNKTAAFPRWIMLACWSFIFIGALAVFAYRGHLNNSARPPQKSSNVDESIVSKPAGGEANQPAPEMESIQTPAPPVASEATAETGTNRRAGKRTNFRTNTAMSNHSRLDEKNELAPGANSSSTLLVAPLVNNKPPVGAAQDNEHDKTGAVSGRKVNSEMRVTPETKRNSNMAPASEQPGKRGRTANREGGDY